MVGPEGRRLLNKINQLAGGSPNRILRMFSYSVANLITRTPVEALLGSPHHIVESNDAEAHACSVLLRNFLERTATARSHSAAKGHGCGHLSPAFGIPITSEVPR